MFQFNKLSGCDAIYEDKALCSARYYLYLIVLFVTFALFVFFSSHKIKQILSNGTNVFVVCIKNIKYFFNRGSHFHQVWLHLVIILKVWSIADQWTPSSSWWSYLKNGQQLISEHLLHHHLHSKCVPRRWHGFRGLGTELVRFKTFKFLPQHSTTNVILTSTFNDKHHFHHNI